MVTLYFWVLWASEAASGPRTSQEVGFWVKKSVWCGWKSGTGNSGKWIPPHTNGGSQIPSHPLWLVWWVFPFNLNLLIFSQEPHKGPYIMTVRMQGRTGVGGWGIKSARTLPVGPAGMRLLDVSFTSGMVSTHMRGYSP